MVFLSELERQWKMENKEDANLYFIALYQCLAAEAMPINLKVELCKQKEKRKETVIRSIAEHLHTFLPNPKNNKQVSFSGSHCIVFTYLSQ